LVAKASGIPVHKITLFLLGGVAQIEKEASHAGTEFWIALVGPLTSGVLGLILLALAWLGGWVPWGSAATPGTALLVWLGYINLSLAAFNMIPGFPLDGGRVLHAILWWAMGDAERSTRAAAVVGQIIAVLFIGFGILRFFQGAGLGGLWIAFIGWFLLQAAGASYMQARARTLLHGLQVRDVMSTDYESVDPNVSLQEFVHKRLLPSGSRCFLVMQESRLLGLITLREVRAIDAQAWPDTSVGEVMHSGAEIHTVPRNMPLAEALEVMAQQDINQLPVVSNGIVEGVVTRSHILQVVQSRAELFLPRSLPRTA